MKVLSLLPRSRFAESGLTIPETLSVNFLPPNGSHALIAAAEKADTEGLSGLSNNILLGKALQEAHFASLEAVEQAVAKCVPPKKQHLLEPNIRAIKLGMSL